MTADQLNESDQRDLPGLPFAPVDQWLRTTLPDAVGAVGWSARVISGGLSNLTYRLALESSPSGDAPAFGPCGGLVLRRPPLSGALPSAHDMVREYRVLSGLYGSGVPVPRPRALCQDLSVLGVPFYVMDEVPGSVLRTAQDTAALSVAQRQVIGDRLAGVLAQLHLIDPAAVGLGDFGRPAGYLARQVKRWGEQWHRSRTRELPEMDVLLSRLAEGIPPEAEQGAGIVHGDFRLDNAVIDLTGPEPEIAAVLDWELSTLGDPLADLGMALAYWHDIGDQDRAQIPVAAGVTAHPGFPTSGEFAAAYAAHTGASLDRLPYYRAFGCMKLAVILEGVHGRYLTGTAIGEGYDGVGTSSPLLTRAALKHLNLQE